MNNQEKIDIGKIAKHIAVLNTEVGALKNIAIKYGVDIKWIKRLIIGIFVALLINRFI